MDPRSPLRHSLPERLKRNRDRVLAAWDQAIRSAPPVVTVRAEAMRSAAPCLLDALIATVEGRPQSEADEVAERQTLMRIEAGFTIQQVAWEHSTLRSAVLRFLDDERVELEGGALTALNEAVDAAIAKSVDTYYRVRSRRLEALDRLSREALDTPHDLDDLLRRLLDAILATAASVDTAAIYLREGDELVLRAGVGFGTGVEGFRVCVGEGFAGTVAARKQPLFTPAAGTDPRVACEIVRDLGVQALYAVPLIHYGDVIGVAMMGSRTASEFTSEDRQVFYIVAERAGALIAQRRAAQERDLLLGILGHDLRAPLSTVKLSAEILQRRGLPESASDTLQRMTSAARRMERMVADLTDYTKARGTGGLPVERRTLDLHDLVTKIVAELRVLHPDRQLRLQLAGDASGEWDGERIAQVVTNLVNNAVAYGDRAKPVTIAVAGDEEDVTLCVHNEGEPIGPQLLAHVFDPLKRGKKGAGLGLGLYIVQQIALAHGGRAEVESTRERGTTFRVRLSRRASSWDPPRAAYRRARRHRAGA